MPKYFSWKKIMTGAIAFTLVTGSAVPVLTSTSQVAVAATTGITPFVDVPAGLYAEKHIYRLSLQQIVKGYENKENGTYTFKYNNTISQQEAVIMAIRFAGLESKLDRTSIIAFADGFEVKEDYKPYIELAFQEGLLDRETEYKLAAEDKSTPWGTKAATREWVTKLVVKTIGAEQKALELANKASAFYDNNSIDGKYIGYVNAAVELGLIKGLTETTFGPTSPINRASFVTILSRAQKDFPIQVTGQHYGVVTAINENSVTIYEDGKETTYSTDASTGYYEIDNDYAIDRSKLVLYGKVSLYAINGSAKFVEAQGTETYVESINAQIGLIDTSKKIIYMKINDEIEPISYDETVKFINAEGKTIQVSELKEKDNVTILTDTFRDQAVPISITVVSSASNQTTVSGVLYNADDRTITVSTDNGYVTKSLASSYKVTIPSVSTATIKDLIKEVDNVVLTLNSKNEVTNIAVADRNMKTMYQPTIVNFDADKKLITVTNAEGNKAEALFLTNNTRYMMDGTIVSYDAIKSIVDTWPNVVIGYASQNNTNTVISYNLVTEYTGEVVSLNELDRIVTFKTEDGTILKLNYSGASVQTIADSNYDYSKIKPGVTLTFALSSNAGEMDSFLMHEKKTLTVSTISSSTKEIRFIDSNKNTYSVLYDEADFKLANGNAAAFADIKLGTTVDATFAGMFIKTVNMK